MSVTGHGRHRVVRCYTTPMHSRSSLPRRCQSCANRLPGASGGHDGTRNVTVMFTGPSRSPRLDTRLWHASNRIATTIALLAGIVGGVVYQQTSTAGVGLGSVTEVQVTGRAGIPADAAAVAVNMAAVNPEDAGYLSAFPCGG